MYPAINTKNQGFDFCGIDLSGPKAIPQAPNPEFDDYNASIREIVMDYLEYDSNSYPHDDVALALRYDCEFGIHIILFSKVINLSYNPKRNTGWKYVISPLAEDEYIRQGGYSDHFSKSDVDLTKIYKNTLQFMGITASGEIMKPAVPAIQYNQIESLIIRPEYL